MPRYRIRTRPDVVVDAVQLTKEQVEHPRRTGDWPAWLQEARRRSRGPGAVWGGKRLYVHAAGSEQIMPPNWWVIQDAKGQLSITDPASFAAAYEAVEE